MALYLYDRHSYTSETTYTWRKYTVKKVTYYTEGDWYAEAVINDSPSPSYSFEQHMYVYFRESIGKYSLDPRKLTISIDSVGSGEYMSPYVYYGVGGASSDPTYGTVYAEYVRCFFRRQPDDSFKFYGQGRKSASGPFQGDARDSFVDTVTGQSYSYKLHNQVNADGFWWMRGAAQTTNVKGAYIDTIEAEFGTYPADGVSGDFWYVLSKRAFPELQIRQSNQLKTSADGWVRVNGQLKQIQQIWVRVNGQLKEV